MWPSKDFSVDDRKLLATKGSLNIKVERKKTFRSSSSRYSLQHDTTPLAPSELCCHFHRERERCLRRHNGIKCKILQHDNVRRLTAAKGRKASSKCCQLLSQRSSKSKHSIVQCMNVNESFHIIFLLPLLALLITANIFFPFALHSFTLFCVSDGDERKKIQFKTR